jgi:hypothetical protein
MSQGLPGHVGGLTPAESGEDKFRCPRDTRTGSAVLRVIPGRVALRGLTPDTAGRDR